MGERSLYIWLWIFCGILGSVVQYWKGRSRHRAALKQLRNGLSVKDWKEKLEKSEFYKTHNLRDFDEKIAKAEQDGNAVAAQHWKYKRAETEQEADKNIKYAKDMIAGRVDGKGPPGLFKPALFLIGGFVISFLVALCT
ncbi:TPA: hypothetical protein QDB01_000392 [Burkholderia vietnamiensis]|nr:hypothetical protein [Burkholderia vietnamiensis]